MKMCVFRPKSFKFVLRGSAPRPRLVMQTHQAETRNPKPSGRMGETRNPGRRGKAKPETQTRAKPSQGRGDVPSPEQWLINPQVPCPFEFHA